MTLVQSSRGDYRIVETTRARLFDSSPDRIAIDAIVTDRNVAPLVTLPDLPTLVLPPGEATKSLAHYAEVLAFFARSGLTRNSRVAALGGGVIGDLVGFAAATYMRGIAYVGVPTTLLAMVDSSVGGKVAVDLPEGKNLAGAFHPPTEVRLDVTFLQTLPGREFAAGMAEVIKTFAISNEDELGSLSAEAERSPGSRDIARIIGVCIDFKRRIVEEDEDETKGRRAILNFGHTIGHAVEQTTGYTRFLHGEAIAIGMVAEARLGERLNGTAPHASDALTTTLRNHGLPTEIPFDLDPEALMAAMRRDKKGPLNFALLAGSGARGFGDARLVYHIPEGLIREVVGHGR